MKTLTTIWNFINSKIFGYVVIIALIFFLANECHNSKVLKTDNLKKTQNMYAADTIITRYKNKDGQYTSEKAIWISTEKQLKQQNKDLYDMVQNQKGKLISLNNSLLNLYQDTTLLHDSIRYFHSITLQAEQLNKTDWEIPWDLNYKWDDKNYDIFKGHTNIRVDTIHFSVKHLLTEMDLRESQIDITFGEKVLDGKYNVYITSKYPGLTAESMKGVLLDPNSNEDIKKLINKNHWFQGIGISLSITTGYDFLNKKPTIVIGPSIGLNLYQW